MLGVTLRVSFVHYCCNDIFGPRSHARQICLIFYSSSCECAEYLQHVPHSNRPSRSARQRCRRCFFVAVVDVCCAGCTCRYPCSSFALAYLVARADPLPVDTLMGKLREVAGEEVAGCIERIDFESLPQPPGGDQASNIGTKVEVFGNAYANLAKLVEQEEETIAVETRVVQDPRAGAGSGASHGPSRLASQT